MAKDNQQYGHAWDIALSTARDRQVLKYPDEKIEQFLVDKLTKMKQKWGGKFWTQIYHQDL